MSAAALLVEQSSFHDYPPLRIAEMPRVGV